MEGAVRLPVSFRNPSVVCIADNKQPDTSIITVYNSLPVHYIQTSPNLNPEYRLSTASDSSRPQRKKCHFARTKPNCSTTRVIRNVETVVREECYGNGTVKLHASFSFRPSLLILGNCQSIDNLVRDTADVCNLDVREQERRSASTFLPNANSTQQGPSFVDSDESIRTKGSLLSENRNSDLGRRRVVDDDFVDMLEGLTEYGPMVDNDRKTIELIFEESDEPNGGSKELDGDQENDPLANSNQLAPWNAPEHYSDDASF